MVEVLLDVHQGDTIAAAAVQSAGRIEELEQENAGLRAEVERLRGVSAIPLA